MEVARWCSRLKTCWCVFALRCRRRAFTQFGILAFSPAIPRSARESCLSRAKIPRFSVHHPSLLPKLPSAVRGPVAWVPRRFDQLELLGEEDDRAPKALRHRWAWLLAHIFAADLECCPRCGGAMRWAEVAKTTRAALRLMAKLGLAPHPPPAAPATPLGQLSLQFDN
jgi:hypothetical protein